MAFDILVSKGRKRKQSAQPDRRDVTAPAENVTEQAKPDNDNDNDDKAWPLIAFPEDWYGS